MLVFPPPHPPVLAAELQPEQQRLQLLFPAVLVMSGSITWRS